MSSQKLEKPLGQTLLKPFVQDTDKERTSMSIQRLEKPFGLIFTNQTAPFVQDTARKKYERGENNERRTKCNSYPAESSHYNDGGFQKRVSYPQYMCNNDLEGIREFREECEKRNDLHDVRESYMPENKEYNTRRRQEADLLDLKEASVAKESNRKDRNRKENPKALQNTNALNPEHLPRPIKHTEIGSSELNISKQNTESTVHYKIPLACWPNLLNVQTYVENLISYCQDIEKKIGMRGQGIGFPLTHVDVYVVGKSFDIACLSSNPETIVQEKIAEYCVSEDAMDNVTEHFAGILFDPHGVQLVRSVANNTIYTERPFANENITDMQQQTSHMIEIAIIKPLLEKIKLLQRLLGKIVDDETHNVIQVKPETEKQHEHQTSQDIPSLTEKELIHAAVSNRDLIRQNKRDIERLLGEMFALTRRSSLPENLRPMTCGFETKHLSKQVKDGLFEIDQTIRYCGYMFNTLHIKVEHIPCSKKNLHRKVKIQQFLMNHSITDYQLDIIEIKKYFFVGAEIKSEYKKTATLGCLSMYKKEGKRTCCGLLSKHLVQGSSKIYLDGTHFGTVLPNTNNEDGPDISAAEIVKDHIKNLDPKFRDFKNITKLAYVFNGEDIQILQSQPVYLRGAMTKLGIGTIRIPDLQGWDGKTYLLLEDGNIAYAKPDGKLAVPGDSGAIICKDDLDSNEICLLSMLVGENLHVRTDEAVKDEKRLEYVSLRLSAGLRYLEDRTQGKFSIQGTVSDTDN